MTLTLNIIMGGALTGAAFNSARALGPMVAIGNFTNAWLYMIAPLVGAKMKRTLLLATAALGALTISVNARDDRLPAKFVGNWCLAEHTADHPSFYRRGRCTNPDNVEDWTMSSSNAPREPHHPASGARTITTLLADGVVVGRIFRAAASPEG